MAIAVVQVMTLVEHVATVASVTQKTAVQRSTDFMPSSSVYKIDCHETLLLGSLHKSINDSREVTWAVVCTS